MSAQPINIFLKISLVKIASGAAVEPVEIFRTLNKDSQLQGVACFWILVPDVEQKATPIVLLIIGDYQKFTANKNLHAVKPLISSKRTKKPRLEAQFLVLNASTKLELNLVS